MNEKVIDYSPRVLSPLGSDIEQIPQPHKTPDTDSPLISPRKEGMPCVYVYVCTIACSLIHLLCMILHACMVVSSQPQMETISESELSVVPSYLRRQIDAKELNNIITNINKYFAGTGSKHESM